MRTLLWARYYLKDAIKCYPRVWRHAIRMLTTRDLESKMRIISNSMSDNTHTKIQHTKDEQQDTIDGPHDTKDKQDTKDGPHDTKNIQDTKDEPQDINNGYLPDDSLKFNMIDSNSNGVNMVKLNDINSQPLSNDSHYVGIQPSQNILHSITTHLSSILSFESDPKSSQSKTTSNYMSPRIFTPIRPTPEPIVKEDMALRNLRLTFLQALLRHDHNRVHATLLRILANKKGILLYVSCLRLLLASFNSSSLRALQQSYEAFIKVSQIDAKTSRDLHFEFAAKFCGCFPMDKEFRSVVAREVITLWFEKAVKRGMDLVVLSRRLDEECGAKLAVIVDQSLRLRKWKLKLSSGCKKSKEISQPEDSLVEYVNPYKDDLGHVNLEGLCEFIKSTGFGNKKGDQKGQDQKREDQHDLSKVQQLLDKPSSITPVWKLYESVADKKSFLETYQLHNLPRQHILEKHMLAMLDPLGQNIIHLFRGPEEIVFRWYKESLQMFKKLVLETANPKHTLSKYSYYLDCIKPESFVTLMLSNMLTQTIAAPNHSVPVVRLASQLKYVFCRFAVREKIQGWNDLPEIEGVQLFSALIKEFIGTCTVSEEDMKGFDGAFVRNGNSPSGFIHEMAYSRGKTIGVILLHPYVFYKYRHFESLSIGKSLYLPMLYPPKPWTLPRSGGYLGDLKPMVSLVDAPALLRVLDEANKTGQLESTYSALNVLSQQSWAINDSVLKVFNWAMNLDQGFLKIPPKNTSNDDLRNIRIVFSMTQMVSNALNHNGDMFFLPHNVDFRGRAYPMVSLLSHYMDDVTRALMMFWEGRPLGPHGKKWLIYQLVGLYGEDKMPLQERLIFYERYRLQFLACARLPNTTTFWHGADKPWQTLAMCMELHAIEEFSGREEDYLTRIPVHMDGSCNGLQHYAALGGDSVGGAAVNLIPSEAKEDAYTRVLEVVEQKNKMEMEKNGLSHRNLEGGYNVNMLDEEDFDRFDIPDEEEIDRFHVVSRTDDIPADEFDLEGRNLTDDEYDLERRNSDDINSGSFDKRSSTPVLASLSSHILSRKLIKQTVMTTVYGVTRHGASEQIHSRISELLLEYDLKVERREVDLNPAYEAIREKKYQISSYLAGLVLDSLLELFQGAAKIQEWLKENCYRVIRRVEVGDSIWDALNGRFSHEMQWTTISGFPVVQLYRVSKPKNIPTALQSIAFKTPRKDSPIDKRKQMNAVAPNYVHLIDLVHMLMTGVEMKARGHSFVAVHDSYWTHAGSVDTLSKLLREQFVRLHSYNLLKFTVRDLRELTRDLWQIVWVKREGEFFEEILRLRGPHKHTLREYTEILEREIKDNAEIERLVEKHKPRCFMKEGGRLQEYGGKESIPFSIKKWFPVLVRVRIEDIGEKGELDLSKVMESVYFYS